MSQLKLALFGSPVLKSPSPLVHKAFASQFGLDLDYRLIEAKPGEFANKLAEFREGGGHGCNITMPLKTIACEMANVSSLRAKVATAANTLWWDDQLRLQADNTDGQGLISDLERNLSIDLEGKTLLLIGAGGAAAGIVGALLKRNLTRLTIGNRTASLARELAHKHSDSGPVCGMSIEGLERKIEYDLVIDATSTGHHGRVPAIPEQILARTRMCYSLNYGLAAQPMAKWCKALGVPFHSGSGMLVEQAACSFEIWTGKAPRTEPVLRRLNHGSG